MVTSHSGSLELEITGGFMKATCTITTTIDSDGILIFSVTITRHSMSRTEQHDHPESLVEVIRLWAVATQKDHDNSGNSLT